jgi:hypothetical protein
LFSARLSRLVKISEAVAALVADSGRDLVTRYFGGANRNLL